MERSYYSDRSDLKISGSGKFGGGKFNSVKISGAGEINGDLDCVDFKCSGSSNVVGDVLCQEFKISGDASIKGDVKSSLFSVSGSSSINGNITSDEMKISGDSKIGGDLSVGQLKISGDSKVGGNLKGDNIKIFGGVRIGGNCEAEHFTCYGAFNIGEMLNAEKIEINPGGECKTNEIGGKEIEVRLRSKDSFVMSFIRFASFSKSRLICDSIEGDNIYLEATKASIVRGKNITIGERCEIDTVEYSEDITILDGAIVKNQIKI
ncbi:polymer-forming cytoskeletal protein [Clostridium sp. YIM B02505]|uniref:Polymer-forming cytoskeletal protein n=1 Tax=Clostridium yunnanense TaxID=2800325 RepID=A0ABS1ET29_9CLOT|nr:polymer-forming cytoskeletal protein [Clostridium yunnanense]MBK1812480.1 polymer-forming cytoskeletal protein [Clostridium yunnanense]